MQSAFTIKVGEKQTDGVRDVSVLHHGEIYFSTSYRNVKWAFLTKFPAPLKQQDTLLPSIGVSSDEKIDDAGINWNIDGDEEHFTSSNEVGNNNNNNKLMHEYLCVFHRDEPKNRPSHYTAHQPSTICSAYSTVNPASITHFVLNNISPTSIVPGLRGVFVHGTRQSSRGNLPKVLQIGGFTFLQAADVWWMASQLTIRPVYTSVEDFSVLKSVSLHTMASMIAPSWQSSSDSVNSKYSLVDATVLTQFQACEGKIITVAICGSEICLATSIIVEHLDILLWVWWPQRLHIPQLRVKGAEVSVTVSENINAFIQILFLFDASRGVLHVLKTPNFSNGIGNLELLFTLLTNCPPVVLPCLRSSMMNPIMVCHYPSVNNVTLYHIPTLLQDPSPSNSIANMSLNNILPKNMVINTILYQAGSIVAFQASILNSINENENKGNNNILDENCKSYIISFPSLLEEQYPLVHFILEALELVLEKERLTSLQCELLRRAWESKRLGNIWDFGTGCIELIADIVRISMKRISNNNNNNGDIVNTSNSNSSYFDNNTVNDKEVRLCDIFVDPIFLTADILQKQSLNNSNSHNTKNNNKNNFETSYSNINVGHLWTQHECGLSVFILHLLCESLKLQERLWNLLEPLANLNLRLCQIMGWIQYVRYYSTCLCVPETDEITRYWPSLLEIKTSSNSFSLLSSQIFQRSLPEHILIDRFIFYADSSTKTILNGTPPILYTILQRVLEGKGRISGGWPAIKNVHYNSPLSMANRLFCMLVDCFDAPKVLQNLSSRWWLLLCRGLLKYNINPKFVSSELCVGVAQPIERALSIAKDHPDETWEDDFNAVIGRLDRIQRSDILKRYANSAGDVLRAAEERAIGRQYRATLNDDDGVIMRPDFPKHWGDSRMDIIQIMLNTSAPIALPSQVDGTDAIYTSLHTLSKRATALPVGRGMFTLCTQNFRVRDSVPIPRLNLEGRTSDGITIANNSDEVTPENLIWPLFHNGCAAGLRFLPLPHFQGHKSVNEDQSITRHWVLYQTRNISCPASRSGLLLAAGLLGHLKVLQRTDIYSLLVSPQSQFSGREAVTIAVMLGLSCSFRGTCNSIVFNCLSMHVQSLTPATEDIEVSLDVQTAALVSIGILHQRTPDAFLVEMLLIQMSRLPSDEHSRDREGYALGAGFGLGLLLLGLGSSHGVPNVENRLLKFMEGARREAVPSASEGLETFNELNPDSGYFLTRGLLARNAKDSFKSQCTRVFEGDCFNIAISGPAAVISLGLMYLQTDDLSMSIKVAPPNRLVGLQGIYPELCLLRSMMSSLIMWSSIEPTKEWLKKSFPSCLLRLVKYPKESGLASAQIRYLMMNLGHCLSGAILALGLRFAGSMDADAKSIVLSELNGFLSGKIGTTGAIITPIQRSTGAFQTCISACTISLSLIMAGTGDGQCLALIQKLYKRTNVKYGDHLSISMATGLLFLGGGQLTLSNSLNSIAALIMAFYPIWPESASDNKMHLQALRQLYCLAVVPRVIETIDILTNRSVSVPVRVIVHRGCLGQNEPSSVVKELWTPLPKGKENQAVRMVTPCLLPDVSTITQIEIRSAQHYNLTIYNTGINVIGDGGIVVRVLEKKNNNNNNTDIGKSVRSPGEELVIDWIQRLFSKNSQQRPSPIEATVILDNVNLLFASQETFLTEFGTSEKEFSLDFVMNVRRTLEKRYCGLLQHYTSLSPYHPLFHIFMKQESVYNTAVSLVQSIKNNENNLSDLLPIIESIKKFSPIINSDNCNEEKNNNISIPITMNWLSQALNFHGLGGSMLLIPQALNNYAPFLQNREQRFFALYKMNQKLLLRPQVVEDLVDCCVGIKE